MTEEQLLEWQLYDQLDPVGEFRADYRLAHLSALIVNIVNSMNNTKARKPKLITASEMMIEWGIDSNEEPEIKQQSIEEMKKAIQKIAKAFGPKEKGIITTTKSKPKK